MKKMMIPLALVVAISFACNNTSKSSVEKADSTNEANLDTALNNNGVTVDEASSSFLVRVANGGIAEVDMASYVDQHAAYADVKSFAAMLHHDHMGVNQAVKDLAAAKNVVLPTAMTEDKQKEVDKIKATTGKDLDKDFVKLMIKNHSSSIESFEKADVKDADVKAFIDKTLAAFRMHLDSAKALEKKYWK